MDSTAITYTDKSYRYVLYNNSDGVSMGVINESLYTGQVFCKNYYVVIFYLMFCFIANGFN
ncbi:hypothetical protein MNBD_GAMMA10-1594 [hydrothermal vent metagenome]|uniref:Uncharacterized protein n=1 Tax=hydrothermal vent metagenome TaxID=652676 RepID=A0A3B0XRR5_9ZZZZ